MTAEFAATLHDGSPDHRPRSGVVVGRSSRLLLALAVVGWFVVAGCRASTDSPRGSSIPEDSSSPSASTDPKLRTTASGSEAQVAALSAARPEDWFVDVTGASGVRFTYRNGEEAELGTILETVGGGVAMLDFDGDRDLDLFFPGGGTLSAAPPRVGGLPCGLFRNDGEFRFTDISKSSGVGGIAFGYTHGASVADFDRDGWPDLLVTGHDGCRLLRNDGGTHFVDATSGSGLETGDWTVTSAWGDFDRDGLPDLFVAGYVAWKLDPADACIDPRSGRRDACPPQRYGPAPQRLFRNLGAGKFEEITEKAGLRTDGKPLGCVVGDVDGDGFLDLYVANDQVRNHLYLGRAEWPFAETGERSATAFNEYGAAEGSMGADLGDFDGDGREDLFVTNFELEDNSLYRNLGGGNFEHATVAMGLGGQGRMHVKWGTAFADFDSDGWLDLATVAGHVFRHRTDSPHRQPAFLLRNRDGRRFVVEENAGGYFRVPHAARGFAVGDLNDDGALDVVVVHQNEPAVLLRNTRVPAAWVRIEMLGETCDKEAIGAVATCRFAGRTLMRAVRGGGSYLSRLDPRIVFPVDGDAPIDVTVRWPGGRSEQFERLTPRGSHVLRQGSGRDASADSGTPP